MPLADAAFVGPNGRTERAALIEFVPSPAIVVFPFVDPSQPPTDGHTTRTVVDTGASRS